MKAMIMDMCILSHKTQCFLMFGHVGVGPGKLRVFTVHLLYSTFTVQYTTLHNVTLHTYIPAKVHQIARTEVMVRNFQGQKSGLMFIKVELSYIYVYNSKDKVLVYIYIYIHIYIYIFNSKDRVLGYIYICNSKDKVLVYVYIYIHITPRTKSWTIYIYIHSSKDKVLAYIYI